MFQKLNIDKISEFSSESGSFENEHSVIIYFNYGLSELDALYDLDIELDRVIKKEKVGVYDYHEITMNDSDGSLYMYGANAENLFKAVKPILDKTEFIRGAVAVLRFGPAGQTSPELKIEL
jgi:hypothetical protein